MPSLYCRNSFFVSQFIQISQPITKHNASVYRPFNRFLFFFYSVSYWRLCHMKFFYHFKISLVVFLFFIFFNDFVFCIPNNITFLQGFVIFLLTFLGHNKTNNPTKSTPENIASGNHKFTSGTLNANTWQKDHVTIATKTH